LISIFQIQEVKLPIFRMFCPSSRVIMERAAPSVSNRIVSHYVTCEIMSVGLE